LYRHMNSSRQIDRVLAVMTARALREPEILSPQEDFANVSLRVTYLKAIEDTGPLEIKLSRSTRQAAPTVSFEISSIEGKPQRFTRGTLALVSRRDPPEPLPAERFEERMTIPWRELNPALSLGAYLDLVTSTIWIRIERISGKGAAELAREDHLGLYLGKASLEVWAPIRSPTPVAVHCLPEAPNSERTLVKLRFQIVSEQGKVLATGTQDLIPMEFRGGSSRPCPLPHWADRFFYEP